MSGEDDFFSVARTMPFVAARESIRCQIRARGNCNAPERTLDPQRGDALIYCVQSILCTELIKVLR